MRFWVWGRLEVVLRVVGGDGGVIRRVYIRIFEGVNFLL